MHQTFRFLLPTIESGKTYSPDSVALEIENFQTTPEGTLRAIRGPCPLIPEYDGKTWPAQYAEMHGIYHASLDSGMRDVTLLRTGDKLCEHEGWVRDMRTLKSGLSNDAVPRFPDQFATVGGRIVWTNGIDTPLIYDGYTLLPLGYSQPPGPITGCGPAPVNASTNDTTAGTADNPTTYRNSTGYSHPGHIGTPGDVLVGQLGCIRDGAWYGYVQFEDAFGNLSPLSAVSGPITIRTEDAKNSYNEDFLAWTNEISLGPFSVHVDDITRQFLWTGIPTGPDGTVARILWRTADTRFNPNDARFLVRIPDNTTTVYPDNHADSELGSAAPDVIAVPTFRVCCSYLGGLAIGNTSTEPGIVRISEPGVAGTFHRDRWVYPDPDGAEVTGLANYGGRLLAFTRDTVFEIVDDGTNPLRAQPITSRIGCVAPSSIQAAGFGMLVWLGRDNFYGMVNGKVQAVSEAIMPTIDSLNKARLPLAAATYSPETGEYLCAVAPGGALGNELMLAFDGQGWRRRTYGIQWASLALTKDDRALVLGCGKGAEANVFVIDREVRSYIPPAKRYRFKSQWLRMDETGRDRFNVNSVYVGFVESCDQQFSWSVYKNGRRDVAAITSTSANALTMVAADNVDGRLLKLIVGTGTVRTPRLFWRRFDIKVTGVDSFAFDLSCLESGNAYPHIAAFAFEGSLVDGSGASVARG